jgi:hypothetical protein
MLPYPLCLVHITAPGHSTEVIAFCTTTLSNVHDAEGGITELRVLLLPVVETAVPKGIAGAGATPDDVAASAGTGGAIVGCASAVPTVDVSIGIPMTSMHHVGDTDTAAVPDSTSHQV